MLTSAIITMVQKEAQDWSRENIRTLIDEVQKIIFTQRPVEQMRIYNSTTGRDPILTTVAGTQEYSINTTNGFPYNAWRVSAVYIDDVNDPETDIFTTDATPNANYAKVVFPNATSSQYYLRCFRFPTTVSAETIQLELPSQYHFDLYDGVMGLIERFRSGKSDRWDAFEKVKLREIVNKLSQGQRRDINVQYRPCGL